MSLCIILKVIMTQIAKLQFEEMASIKKDIDLPPTQRHMLRPMSN